MASRLMSATVRPAMRAANTTRDTHSVMYIQNSGPQPVQVKGQACVYGLGKTLVRTAAASVDGGRAHACMHARQVRARRTTLGASHKMLSAPPWPSSSCGGGTGGSGTLCARPCDNCRTNSAILLILTLSLRCRGGDEGKCCPRKVGPKKSSCILRPLGVRGTFVFHDHEP